jgi:hypothetical protein
MPLLSFDARRVVISLETQPKTELELIETLDMRPSVLRGHVQELMAADLVHITAHMRERGGKRVFPVFAAGSKVRPSARPRRPKSVERLTVPARQVLTVRQVLPARSVFEQWTGRGNGNVPRR